MSAVAKLGAAVVGAMTIAASVWSQPLEVPPGRWWERPRIAAELVLTDDQRAALESVSLAHAKTMIDLKAEVEKCALDLRAAANAEPFDAKRVREAFVAMQQRRTRLEQERFELLLKEREVLTSEQWHKLTALVRERQQREGGAPGNQGGARQFRQRPY
jgi:Spy/CpxP family protein refolding chaperone